MTQNRHATYDLFLGHGHPLKVHERNRNYWQSAVKRVTALTGIGTSGLLAGCEGAFSILAPAGPNAHSAAWLWWGMFGWFTLVLVVVIALWLYAIRRSPTATSEARAGQVQKRWIIWGGLVLPITSMAVILALGIPAGHRMLPLPLEEGQALRINVTAHQWWWEVHYPESDITLKDELHIPAGVPLDLHLTSADVIHSFWVPRLGGKLDMLPGRTNVLRLHADEPGTYRGQCAEFCGTQHAHMKFTVIAHSPEDYQTWLRQEASDE